MISMMRPLHVAGALLLLAACQGPVAQSTATGTASPAEVGFTTNAFQIIRFDQQQGTLAQTQARNPRVKALAQQLTNEANDFEAQLTPLAANAGIKPPAVLRNDLRVRLGHMQLQQGLDFDRTYVADQIASHEEALMMQDSMSNANVSPPFADLIQKGKALVGRNLDTLRALQAEMRRAGASAAAIMRTRLADPDQPRCGVTLAGHPKLRRNLRRPTMEEIGYRTTVFSLEGVTGSQREYIEWTLTTCAAEGVRVDDILDPAAVDLLAARLRTPLQIEQHLTLALETGYQASEKPVGEGIVDSGAVQVDRRPGTHPDPARLYRQSAGRAAGHQAWQVLSAGLPV